MPSIQLTNNTDFNLTAVAEDKFASLTRYLKQPLTLLTPAGLTAIAATKVSDVDPMAFPVSLTLGGEGKFAVEETSLDVQSSVAPSVGYLAGADASDFFDYLGWSPKPSSSLVSFGLQTTVSAGDSATLSDFCFGITGTGSVSLTSYCTADPNEKFTDALQRAVASLTIPHDLDDLKSLPVNSVCQINAESSLQFSASVTYNVLNDPLATTAISNLPSIAVNASASATVEAEATHTACHTVSIAKVKDGVIHLSVDFTRTDDFETSLTVSAGATAKIGNTDAVSFLLGLISPNATTELKKIQTEMPADQAHQLGRDIKSAIDAALSSSLQVSLKAALDASHSRSRVFLYEIDLNALDAGSTAALQSAVKGDLTAMTASGADLAGIRELDSALTVTSQVQHTLTLHLLGIFNWSDTHTFVQQSKVDFTKDTHELVLSDERINVVTNNLMAEKLRQVVLKAATLTIPASANTPGSATPLNLVFFDRQAGANASKLRQITNVLQLIGASGSVGADANGVTSLFLQLKLNPPQCRQLYLDTGGRPFDWTVYLRYVCNAQAAILQGDPDNADRFRLYDAGEDFWKQLQDLGAGSAQVQLLADNGIRANAYTDVTTTIWWSFAMEAYAKAVAGGKSLAGPGKDVVKDSTRGFSEPWMILAVWLMLGKPAIASQFASSSSSSGNVASAPA